MASAEVVAALAARGMEVTIARDFAAKLACEGFSSLAVLAMATKDDVMACGIDAEHAEVVLLAATGGQLLSKSPRVVDAVVAELEKEGMDAAAAASCAKALASEGFTTVESLSKVDEDDLVACGITLRMHVKTILGLGSRKSEAKRGKLSPVVVGDLISNSSLADELDWSQLTAVGGPWQSHTNTVNCVTFSPNGLFIASGSYDDTVKLWTNTGRLVSVLRAHAKAVNDVSFASSGQLLVSASKDASVKIWDLEKAQVKKTLVGHSDRVWCCLFAKQDTLVLSGSEDRTVIVWHAETGTILSKLTACHSERVACMAVSSDSLLVATGSWDKLIKLWKMPGHSLETGSVLSGHSMGVQSVKFTADSTMLVSGSNDESVRVWNVATGQAIFILSGHFREVNSISVFGNSFVASASCSQEVKVWDLQTGRVLKTLTGHSGYVRSVCWSPNGRSLVSGSNDYTLRLYAFPGN